MMKKELKSWALLWTVLGAFLLLIAVAHNARTAPSNHREFAAKNLPITTVAVPKGQQVATLAAGCFWSMEGIFEQLKGVKRVEPGYAGGSVASPSYEQVCTETTGHAETVNIFFDPKVISYRSLLEVMLTIRNPTTLNQQGPDFGESYRSVIFTHNAGQQEVAKAVLADFTSRHVWPNPIVTQVTPFRNFYEAEAYHRDYYRRHPDDGYSVAVIAPEIETLKQKFPGLVQTK